MVNSQCAASGPRREVKIMQLASSLRTDYVPSKQRLVPLGTTPILQISVIRPISLISEDVSSSDDGLQDEAKVCQNLTCCSPAFGESPFALSAGVSLILLA